MKHLLVLFVMLSSNQQCNDEGQLNIKRATSQSWSGGAAATRGTYYHLYLAMTMNADYKFDSLWVNDHRVAVEVMRGNSSNDSVHLYANDRLGIQMPGSSYDPSKSAEANFPVASNAEGLLGYYYKGTRKYYPVAAFEKLEAIAYQ